MTDFDRTSLAAQRTAEALFVRHLTPQQRFDWRTYRRFRVTGSRGGQYWLIGQYSHNVIDDHFDLRFGVAAAVSYCVVFRAYRAMPLYDTLLMQKLLLESDEGRFLSTAIRMPFRPRW